MKKKIIIIGVLVTVVLSVVISSAYVSKKNYFR
jgi:hypothetical protein